MSVNFRNDVAYGLSQSLIDISLRPIVSNRAPTTGDFAPLGSLWIDRATSQAYILVQTANSIATWNQLSAATGSGNFNALTVNPGPTDLTGTTNINVGAAGATNIGTTGTGVVTIGNTTGNTSINGDVTVSSGQLNIASSADGIAMSALASVGPAATPVTLNARIGRASFSDVIINGNTDSLVINNSVVTSGAAVIATVACATATADLVISNYTSGVGTLTCDVTNLGSNPTADPIVITFWVLN